MMKRAVLAAMAMAMWAAVVNAAVAAKEDLAGGECALPHGEVVLPVVGTFEAAHGEFLKFADGSLVRATDTWSVKKPEDVAAMQQGRTADLAFLPEDNGTLWAVSGRIVDLGVVYLAGLSGIKMDRPAMIRGIGGRPAGMIRGVEEGRTFLLETTDGKFALVRVLEISKVGAVVQYVYQPVGGAGGVTFEVPRCELVDVVPWVALKEPGEKVKREAPKAVEVGGGAKKVMDVTPSFTHTPAPSAPADRVNPIEPKAEKKTTILEPPFEHHMRQREMMIETRIQRLKGAAKTQAEIEKKVDAINELAEMRAETAADEMVKQVAFLNPKGAGTEFQDSVHPCFAALKKLGSIGGRAAVKGLRELDLGSESDGGGLDSPLYRAGLLALVIRAVEGDDVGLYILRRERMATTDAKRQQMYDQLISPEVRNIR
ncbi:MAG: hypothetical protein FWD53_01715 [Phycisphaerales bacterium]|nr:hypothetical protein [Phycisphaerales bacterium]